MRRVVIDAHQPDATVLVEAATLIRGGGVVAVPTDTLYGLAADPFSAVAVERVFAIKARSAERALPLMAADITQIESRLGPLPPAGQRLAAAYWPGPLTLLVPRPSTLAADVTGGLDQVGVRVPAHAVARALCRACGNLLTATSANLSGAPASADPDEVARTMGEGVGLLLDAGPTAGGPPSTIVDVSGRVIRLVRPGAIPWDDVQACLGRV
jgi:L-threonylcarbamoyladenylate synthase